MRKLIVILYDFCCCLNFVCMSEELPATIAVYVIMGSRLFFVKCSALLIIIIFPVYTRQLALLPFCYKYTSGVYMFGQRFSSYLWVVWWLVSLSLDNYWLVFQLWHTTVGIFFVSLINFHRADALENMVYAWTVDWYSISLCSGFFFLTSMPLNSPSYQTAP